MEEEELFNDGLDEFDDFDLTNAKYQVWLLGETSEQLATDFEYLVGSFDDSEAAENKAAEIYDDPSEILKKVHLPRNTKIIVVQVETVIDYEGIEMNIETIYRRKIEVSE